MDTSHFRISASFLPWQSATLHIMCIERFPRPFAVIISHSIIKSKTKQKKNTLRERHFYSLFHTRRLLLIMVVWNFFPFAPPDLLPALLHPALCLRMLMSMDLPQWTPRPLTFIRLRPDRGTGRRTEGGKEERFGVFIFLTHFWQVSWSSCKWSPPIALRIVAISLGC